MKDAFRHLGHTRQCGTCQHAARFNCPAIHQTYSTHQPETPFFTPPESMDRKALRTGTPSTTFPEDYVRPISERPGLSEVADCKNVPTIDLSCKDGSQITEQIRDACTACGFFQVVNHGPSAETIGKMLDVAKKFFQLPGEEKMKLSSYDPLKETRLSTSFNVKKKKAHY